MNPLKINFGKYFCITIVIFFILSIMYNFLFGKKGSYINHKNSIFQLFFKPVNLSEFQKKTFISRGEIECKSAIEEITGEKFVKKRPDFLKNVVTNQNLELDCFNEDLKIAVEYNGKQHYEFTPFFHKNKESFFNLKYRDEMKKKLCRENNVLLIIVPYYIDLKDIYGFIRREYNKSFSS